MKLSNLFLVLILITCSPAESTDGLTPNETAHFLAGYKTGKLNEENSPESQKYRDSLAISWERLEKSRLMVMRSWAANELGGLRDKAEPVFYPFSGPDFVHVYAFFPKGTVYVLGGLEPVGELPDLTKLNSMQFASMYQEIQSSLQTILAASFFRTNDMKKDFAQAQLNGVVPVLALFMVRSGADILEITPVRLDRDGLIVTNDSRINGVKMVFQVPNQPPQTLYYFQVDVSDDGTKGPSLPKLIANLGTGVTYLKSASYLMYRDSFSIIRGALLAHSSGLLEDDSGIPLKFFPSKDWKTTVYGSYTGPIQLFAVRFQPDLLALYQQSPKPKPLPFGIGYKFRPEDSNLLWAVRTGGN